MFWVMVITQHILEEDPAQARVTEQGSSGIDAPLVLTLEQQRSAEVRDSHPSCLHVHPPPTISCNSAVSGGGAERAARRSVLESHSGTCRKDARPRRLR